jgi:hypothetical protein
MGQNSAAGGDCTGTWFSRRGLYKPPQWQLVRSAGTSSTSWASRSSSLGSRSPSTRSIARRGRVPLPVRRLAPLALRRRYSSRSRLVAGPARTASPDCPPASRLLSRAGAPESRWEAPRSPSRSSSPRPCTFPHGSAAVPIWRRARRRRLRLRATRVTSCSGASHPRRLGRTWRALRTRGSRPLLRAREKRRTASTSSPTDRRASRVRRRATLPRLGLAQRSGSPRGTRGPPHGPRRLAPAGASRRGRVGAGATRITRTAAQARAPGRGTARPAAAETSSCERMKCRG